MELGGRREGDGYVQKPKKKGKLDKNAHPFQGIRPRIYASVLDSCTLSFLNLWKCIKQIE